MFRRRESMSGRIKGGQHAQRLGSTREKGEVERARKR